MAGIRPLLRKELRQVRRSRGALLSATLLPVVLMVLTPGFQLVSLSSARPQASLPAAGSTPLPADLVGEPRLLLVRFLFPLFLTLGGLVVPSATATYTVVAERERRTIELLLALPTRVSEILLAKLLAMLGLAAGVVLPLFALDAAVLLGLRLAEWSDVALWLVVLLAALTYAVSEALLLALLARDLRTAQQINGALLLPVMALSVAVLVGAPSSLRLPLLAAILLLGAGLAMLVGLRWLTAERYLL